MKTWLMLYNFGYHYNMSPLSLALPSCTFTIIKQSKTLQRRNRYRISKFGRRKWFRIMNSFPRHLGANITGFNIKIVHFYIYRKLDIIRYDTCFFKYGIEPVLIQPILNSFEAILENNFHSCRKS